MHLFITVSFSSMTILIRDHFQMQYVKKKCNMVSLSGSKGHVSAQKYFVFFLNFNYHQNPPPFQYFNYKLKAQTMHVSYEGERVTCRLLSKGNILL